MLERFLFELTISGRAIWGEECLGADLVVEGLKQVNEINHRVMGTARSLRSNYDRETFNACWDSIQHNVGLAPKQIRGHFGWAMRKALESVDV